MVAGAQGYLIKPDNPGMIVDTVNRLTVKTNRVR
jgi:hypothetical protein